jgi:4-hydroxy-2-oxoheptanedioate aldolase
MRLAFPVRPGRCTRSKCSPALSWITSIWTNNTVCRLSTFWCNSADEARQAVAGCRYQPGGVRSWGPWRASFELGGDPAAVDAQVLCLVMIETIAGVAAVDEIVAVPGVDGVYIGPADLAVSMGLKPGLGFQDGPHRAAIDRIRLACTAAGKVCAVSGDPNALFAQGFRMVTAGGDVGFLQAGLNRISELKANLRHRT